MADAVMVSGHKTDKPVAAGAERGGEINEKRR